MASPPTPDQKDAPKDSEKKPGILKQTFDNFSDDDCPSMAAALSYYTAFSLPPLLILILLILSTFLDSRVVQDALTTQIENLMGSSGSGQVRELVESTQPPGGSGLAQTIVGIGTLALGATGVFVQLQSSLNRTWRVAPDPKKGGIKSFLMKRVFSFGLVLGIAFLLLVSLAVTAVLSAVNDRLGAYIPFGDSQVVVQIVNFIVTFPVITLLFAAILKIMPDATIAWRDVWPGAVVTGILFLIGKWVLGYYLGQSNPGEPYGAAGSLAVLLVWIYYSSMILLFGAEFTQVWAERKGQGIVPEEGAVRVVVDKRPAHEPPSHVETRA